MGDFSKKLLGIFLGISLSLGVGVSLSNGVHREAVGVEAADCELAYKIEFYTGSRDAGQVSSQITANKTQPSTIIKTNSDKISSISSASTCYYASNTGSNGAGKGGIRVGKSKDTSNGSISFKLNTNLENAYKVVISSYQINLVATFKLSVDESSDDAVIPAYSSTDYSFILNSTNISTITINTTGQLWVKSFTLYTKTTEPEVTDVTLSPSDDVTLAVGKSKSFTVGILGNNLSGSETVTASYEEIMLDNPGVIIDKTEGIKDGDVITATATLADAGGTLTINYNDSISASVNICTEAAKTPTKLDYSGTPITTYVAGQSFDPTGLTFKVFYGDEDTTGTEIDVEHISFDPSTLSEDTTSVIGSYTENEATVSFIINGITVEEDYIADVIFDTDNAKTTYQIGEEWVDSETCVTGLGKYKVNKDDLLELTATDFTYSGYDSSIAGKQTITVTYPNSKSETPFSAIYTVNVVSETLEKLVSKGDGYYHLVTDYTTLSAGDKIVIAENTKSVVSGDLAKKTFGAYDTYLTRVSDSTFSSDKKTITSLGEGALVFTLSGDSTAWHLLNENGDMLGATAAKVLTWDSSSTNYNSDWKIENSTSTADGVTYTGAAITNGRQNFGKILYNVNSPRFLNYTSDVSKSMLIPQIYKLSEDVYKTHDASLAVVNTVKTIYNDGYLSCDTSGVNSTIQWTEIKNLFSTNVTDTDELEFLKEALSDETASNGTIKKFLADYDYILSKYNAAPYLKGYADFLGRNIVSSNAANKIYKSNDNNSTITIVLVVALCSVTVFGGYFFIKKRKYN